MPLSRGGTSTTNYSDCLSRKCPYLAQMTAGKCLDCKGDMDVKGTVYINGISITVGAGAPSAAAAKGSLYIRTDGAADSLLYCNNNGSTGWSAVSNE